MWRSRRADGQLSDMANLSWAKAAVLAAAERDIAPPKSPVKRTVFESKSPYVAPIEFCGVGWDDSFHTPNPRPRRARGAPDTSCVPLKAFSAPSTPTTARLAAIQTLTLLWRR